MDMRAMTCRLPEPKALKMRYLLALPELQHGSREVRLRTARELRGLAQYAAIAMPHLRTELPVLDMMLSEVSARVATPNRRPLEVPRMRPRLHGLRGTRPWRC